MTILIFFLVLFVLILVHEWGHFIVAKKTGMRVDEFAIGFPPKLFGIKKGETEYTFNLLPIGGFVRIFGEDGSSDLSSPSDSNAVGGRSEASAEATDLSRAFSRRPKWAQTAVLVAGVTMNVIFAWFLFVLVFLMGVPTVVDESEVGPDSRLVVTEVIEGGPAFDAGIPTGATITQFGDDTSLLPSSFREYTSNTEGELSITFESGGTLKTVAVTPESGLIEGDEDAKAVGLRTALVENVRRPLPVALYDATVRTGESIAAITVGLGGLLWDSVRMEADLSQVAGPVGIVGLVGDAAEFGFTSLLMFTAIISLNLAVINLLPFPALDGGRLLFVAIEAATHRPINPVWVARLNTIGFILLMALMFAVTYSDIAKLI